MPSLFELLDTHRELIVERSVDRIRNDVAAYAQLPRPEVQRRLSDAIKPILYDVRDNTAHQYANYMQQLSYERSKQGVPLTAIQEGVRVANNEIIRTIREHVPNSNGELVDMVDRLHRISERGIIGLYAGYEQAQQEIIATQQLELQELSTPIIPIFKGILVLPIVGSIDSNRAGQIMEALLEQINDHSADIVILDITGVPVIDTGVANYLLQAARAARLLGSNVVLVGIGPEIAQTIVQLGIDLSGIVTRANLQSGIEYALDMRGLAIRPK